MEWSVQIRWLGSEMAKLRAQKGRINGPRVALPAERNDLIAPFAVPTLCVTYSDLP